MNSMDDKKQRSDAQRAADARYAEKNPNRQRVLGFKFSTAEADEIEKAIDATGLSKADFLRQAVQNIKK